jgi:hypothetical protein
MCQRRYVVTVHADGLLYCIPQAMMTKLHEKEKRVRETVLGSSIPSDIYGSASAHGGSQKRRRDIFPASEREFFIAKFAHDCKIGVLYESHIRVLRDLTHPHRFSH